jgi:hypothetical protein
VTLPRLPYWLERYRALPRDVWLLVVGQFLLNLMNTGQFLLLNLFLKQHRLGDPEIAALSSQRFVAVFLLAIPAGLWLRGRRLRRPMVIGGVLFPLMGLLSLEAVRHDWLGMASWCFLLMGFGSLVLNVASLPLLLRIAPKDQASEALSLQFATWAAASILGGALSATLQGVGSLGLGGVTVRLDEYAVLLLLTLCAFGAPLIFARLHDPPPPDRPSGGWLRVERRDFPVLLRALGPTLCIATGAGLSIQFLNLFFHTVHGVDAQRFSMYGTVSNVLVLFAGLIVPEVKRKFGWRGAIIGVQGMAVVLLAVLGLTELWAAAVWAMPLAVALMIVRQPLMSMAAPVVSELTMSFVGDRNRELISACNGAVWSGSWWLAARVFQVLRGAHLPYWSVLLITSALYLVGTLLYLGIIAAMDRRRVEESAADGAECP